jgi:hypothetical protein
MRFSSAVAVASLIAVGTAQAQGGGEPKTASCINAVAGDVCNQAVDFFRYMAPQLGTGLTGGNTTIGQGGAMGGRTLGVLPKFAISIRGNAVLGNVPKFTPTVGDPAAREIGTESLLVPGASVDLAVGVFKGVPLGVTTVGGVDVLASVMYLPTVDTPEIKLTPESNTSIGYGLRVGLLQESLVMPGVGFSFLSRALPVVDLSTQSGTSNFTISKFDLSSFAWRLTASKSLLIVGLAAGIGQDKYKTSVGSIVATNGGTSVTATPPEVEATRTNMFVDLTMNLFILKIVGTVGQVSGGEVKTFNSFDNPADISRKYASLGVRFGL